MDDLISRLSELRCRCNCFDENERDAYHTLSDAIKALSDVGDTISRQAAIDELEERLQANGCNVSLVSELNRCIGYLMRLPSAQPEVRPIDYRDCSNAMLMIWMDNVVTDGEYNRIMDKLNAHWGKKDG